MLEVLAEVLPTAAPPFVVLELAEEILGQEVGPWDESDAAACVFGQTYGVAPEVVAMGLDVLEDEVDGLAGVPCRAASRAAPSERNDELVELLAHLLEVVDGLVLGEGGNYAQHSPQLVEEDGAAAELLCDLPEGDLGSHGL